MGKIIKVWNPYFSRDFEQRGEEIILKDTGTWVTSWTERKRCGLFIKTLKKQKEFKTKEKANEFMYKLLAKFYE